MLTTTLFATFSIIALASFLQTITGFGFALAATPLLAFFMEPKDAIMLVLATGMITKVLLLAGVKIQGRFADIAPLFIASLVGALPGAYMITTISTNALKAFIGIILLATTWAMCANCTVKFSRPRLAENLVGLCSGFLGATTSLSGPPVVLFYLNEKTEKERLRANLTRFFLLGNLATLALSYGFGTLHLETLVLPTIISVPAIAVGVWVGEKLFKHLDASLFRRLAITIISISGMMTAYTGLSQLLK